MCMYSVKATTPLWTAGLAWALWRERVSRGVGLALLLIAAGVAVASATELHFDALGLAAALSAAALLSLQHLYSKRAMRDTGVHHLRLLQVSFVYPTLNFIFTTIFIFFYENCSTTLVLLLLQRLYKKPL